MKVAQMLVRSYDCTHNTCVVSKCLSKTDGIPGRLDSPSGWISGTMMECLETVRWRFKILKTWYLSGNTVLICIIGTQRKVTEKALEAHWKHSGYQQLFLQLHPLVSQWQYSVNLHNWNTEEGHWKSTGSTLETQWLPAIISPVAFQCTLEFQFQAHRHTGLPQNYH